MRNFLNKGISTTLGLIIIIGLALLATGGIFAYQKFSQPGENVQQIIQNTQDETANWKTYTNAQYGFEIKYPAENRTLKNDATGTGFAGPDLIFSVLDNITDHFPESYTGIYAYADKEKNEVAKCLIDSSGQKIIKTKNINGVNFFVVWENNSDAAMGGQRSLNDEYHVVVNNTCYKIISSVFWRSVEFVHGATDMIKPTPQELEDEQNWIKVQQQLNNRILSTFKFTN